MSSDDSDCDDEGKEILVTRPLTWLSDSVQHFKRVLDEEIMKEKNPQSRRQMKGRVEGIRSPPDPGKYPSWVLQ